MSLSLSCVCVCVCVCEWDWVCIYVSHELQFVPHKCALLTFIMKTCTLYQAHHHCLASYFQTGISLAAGGAFIFHHKFKIGFFYKQWQYLGFPCLSGISEIIHEKPGNSKCFGYFMARGQMEDKYPFETTLRAAMRKMIGSTVTNVHISTLFYSLAVDNQEKTYCMNHQFDIINKKNSHSQAWVPHFWSQGEEIYGMITWWLR